MSPTITAQSLHACLPDTESTLRLPGLEGVVTVHRDAQGIPHAQAGSAHDAFFAQGFVQAQDRMWHMEYDRRRAAGRWSEAAGPAGLAEDKMYRRFRIMQHLPAHLAALAPDTRAMLDAYAAGVNAFLTSTQTLPVEYSLSGITPEPWQALDSLAVFMVRHILMGVWEAKVWRARLLYSAGPEKVAAFHPGYQAGQLVIVPPGQRYVGAQAEALDDLREGLGHLTFLKHGLEDGSNNWVVGPQRTASGKPLLAGDPHRALDVPNVYYQNHVACPDFDVIGFSFPGVPGFPHFAHNARVAWAITHGIADYQDLYVERFDPADPTRYEVQGGWETAQHSAETIHVRGAESVTLDTWQTRHGPIIGGSPASGEALAFRYTALEAPNGTLDAIRSMLYAENADALEHSMASWVDPVNNMVYFDRDGNHGYRTRGHVPLRDMANAWLPVPGWSGDREWQGMIPYGEMPAVRNPECGYAYTANNRIVGEDYPHYIGLEYAPGYRAERIYHHLHAGSAMTVEDMAAMQADVVSVPGQGFAPLWQRVAPADKACARALHLLKAWDGRVAQEAVAPSLFAAVRKAAVQRILEPQLEPQLLAEVFNAADRGANGLLARTQARLHICIAENDTGILPPGTDWESLLSAAVQDAVQDLTRRWGPDMATWNWGREHRTAAVHPLSAAFPEAAALLDPPQFAMDGDGDTVQAGGYYVGQDFASRFISVARYIFDGADWENSRWVVPGGVSGHPGSPHYMDQVQSYAQHEYLPMTYGWERLAAQAKTTQTLEPEA